MKFVDQSNSLVILHDKKFNEIKSNPRSPKHNITNNLVKVARKRSLVNNGSKSGNYRSGRNTKPSGSTS